MMDFGYKTYLYKRDEQHPFLKLQLDIIKSKYKIGKSTYFPFVASLDIETTNLENKCAYMYIWQFSLDNECIVYGRTWDDYIDFINYITEYLHISTERKLLVGVHNLSFEFSFIRKLFDWDKVFAIEQRKPLYAISTQGIEYTCTYLMSGLSLGKLGTETIKLNYDYYLKRNSKTELSDDELHYCFNDVIIVVEYLHKQILNFGKITKIPRTITGVVRKQIKKLVKDNKESGIFHVMVPKDKLELMTLQNAFCGGFTHSNPYNTSSTLTEINSMDLTSAYPSIMVSRGFPSGESHFVEKPSIELLKRKDISTVVVVKFTNLKNTFDYDSYLSENKCKLSGEKCANGRVFSAAKCITTITNIDYNIIENVYEWESVEFLYGYFWYNKLLPKSYYIAIQDFYKAKTELKGVSGKEEEYLNKKGMLNSLYGMCVTNDFKNEITYDNDEWNEKPIDINDVLEQKRKDRSSFSAYVIGIFITAYVRQVIWSAILHLGEDYVYTDTDSVKFYGNDFSIFEKYNDMVISKVKECYKKHGIDWDGIYYTVDGKPKPLGVWDYEGQYSRFKTLGAKRYLYEENGHLGIALAGCPKKNAIDFLKNYDDPFEQFTNDLHLDETQSGKLCSYYNDEETSDYIDNVLMTEKSSVCLLPTDFTLGMSWAFTCFINELSSTTDTNYRKVKNYVL